MTTLRNKLTQAVRQSKKLLKALTVEVECELLKQENSTTMIEPKNQELNSREMDLLERFVQNPKDQEIRQEVSDYFDDVNSDTFMRHIDFINTCSKNDICVGEEIGETKIGRRNFYVMLHNSYVDINVWAGYLRDYIVPVKEGQVA